jgi:hypothetical protein
MSKDKLSGDTRYSLEGLSKDNPNAIAKYDYVVIFKKERHRYYF